MARWHWVSLAVADALPEAEVKALIRGSYELVRGKLSRKAQREFAD
jgi:predicted DNA-binding protein (MmcQ/YjbR family)